MEVIEGDTITALKRHLNKYMDSRGLGGYGQNAGKLETSACNIWKQLDIN